MRPLGVGMKCSRAPAEVRAGAREGISMTLCASGSSALAGFRQVQFRRQCPRRGADPAVALDWWQLPEWVDLAFKAPMHGGPGGVGLVLAGHRARPPGVGRELRAKPALLGSHAVPPALLPLAWAAAFLRCCRLFRFRLSCWSRLPQMPNSSAAVA